MTDRFVIALAQINPTVGDVGGNIGRVRQARAQAAAMGADLVVAGELVVSGYPPEDLVLKPMFLDAVTAAVEAFARETADGGPAVLLTAPWRGPENSSVGDSTWRRGAFNAVLLIDGGAVQTIRCKYDLPNYGVFDEKRVFTPGPMPGPIKVRGVRLGVMICEDMWTPDVTECLEESGAEILIVPNGSPFESDKLDERIQLAVARIKESGLPLVYVNQIGGQDELVFDGASFVLDAACNLRIQAPAWRESVVLSHWQRNDTGKWECAPGEIAVPASTLEQTYQAMVIGLRDYVDKNRFPGVVLGLSGGIDSALSAAVAVDGLGANRVRAIMMPSPYTSRDSLEDAAEVARLLGIRLDTILIQPAMAAFAGMLAYQFAGRTPDITEENIQSRARGMTLMALSNKFGHMVLSTGNKSEMSVGYATLYGDMCGGYAVLKDVYKTMVFALSRWRNQSFPAGAQGPHGRVMPERVITKPPTAELKPNQTDQDTLPPYDVLDDILRGLIEGEEPIGDIVKRGHDEATVRRVWRMLDRAEYKRRQAPPGVKITRRAFGRERRYPITNAYQG
ncbi:MAG: NAD+ synthase [Alphaproteobacteria bacterium]|nr:NAD+ synthase [Alphaproteobacteria bacterium]